MDRPCGPDGWQLFNPSVSKDGPITQDGLERAAAALSAALERAEHAVRDGSGVYEAYDSFVAPIAEEYDAMGAADSEPRDVAIDYLFGVADERS
jgi:hypothetical protein